MKIVGFFFCCLFACTLAIGQTTAQAYFDLGKKYYNYGDYESAIQQLSLVIKEDKNYAEAYVYRGLSYSIGFKKYVEAIADFSRAIEINPKYRGAYNARGVAYYDQKNYAQAISDCSKAIELNPEYTKSYGMRGLAYYAQKNYAQAISDYSKAIELEPTEPRYYNNRGQAYLNLGQCQKAIEDWDTMVKVADADYVPANKYITEARQKRAEGKCNDENTANTVAKPAITWLQPANPNVKSTDKTYPLRALLNCREATLTLYVNGSSQNTRDFAIRAKAGETMTTFQKEINLNEGENELYIEAVVKGEILRSSKVTISYQPPIVKTAPPAFQEKRIALVIGNGQYILGNSLKNPRNDAEAMKKQLGLLGFTVIYRLDRTYAELQKDISEFGREAKNYDLALFYYAGHGIQYADENFLVPVNAQLEYEETVRAECVSLNLVLDNLRGADVKVGVLILDACRTLPFKRNWVSKRRTLGTPEGLRPMTPPSGTLIAYAADVNQTADDNPTEPNGLYTSILLKYLKVPGLTLEQIFKHTRSEIIEKTGKKQEPAEYNKMTGEDIILNKIN